MDKAQLQQHCEESWQFLNKKYPPSLSPMLHNNDNNNTNNSNIGGADDEKFITFEDKDAEQKTQIKMFGISGSNEVNIPIQQQKIILTDFFYQYSKKYFLISF